MVTTTTGVATSFIQFTRASNATVTDSDGKVKWAPHNLLLASESFDAASWTKSSVTPTANSFAAPNGTTTADTLAASGANGTTLQTFTAEAVSYTFGVWLKRKTGTGTIEIAADSGAYTAVTITSDWALYTVTQTPAAGSKSAGIRIVTSADEVYAWGAALYRSDLAMQPNTSAYTLYNPTTPKNLLGYTESLTTGWTNSNTTDTIIVSEVNPVGLTGAVDVAATAGNGTLLSSLSLLASPYTFSIWLKRKTGSGTVEITVDGTTYAAAAVTGTWTRFSTTLTPTAGTKTPGIRLVTSGDAVYAWGAQLSDSGSLDPYVPVYGAAVTSAAYYGPRRDFDGATLACKGLLVEQSKTNLLLNSATLSTQNVTVTAAAHTLTFYGTGTITLSGTSTAGPLVGTGVNSRVSLTFTPSAGTLTLTVTGSVTQAQIELGSFATSYYPTTAASAARSADVATVSTQAFPYSQSAGSLIVNLASLSSAVTSANFAVLSAGDSPNDRIALSRTSAVQSLFRVATGGSTQFSLNNTIGSGAVKIGAAFTSGDFASVADGGAAQTTSTGTLPTNIDKLHIGKYPSASGDLNGHIRQITYLPRRISNTELQTRTA